MVEMLLTHKYVCIFHMLIKVTYVLTYRGCCSMTHNTRDVKNDVNGSDIKI